MAAAPAKGGECVKVVIRCRPVSRQEQIDNNEVIVDMDLKGGVARVRKPGTSDFKDFTFDAVYGDSATQVGFYDETGYAIVESVGWLQWHHLRLWSDWHWKDTHNGRPS